MLPPITATLSTGSIAEMVADRWVTGAVQLLVDGTPQSHVNLRDPREVFFEYVRRIAHAIDLFRAPGTAIAALHLGAGALTLPRYIAATRPGSRQQVIELERELVALVHEVAPLPKRASIRIRYGDARDTLARLPAAMIGAMDLIVLDIFAGARTPAHVSSLEFYRELKPLLATNGMIAVNVADGSNLSFARSQAATLAAVCAEVVVIGEPQTLKGRRFGNIVLLAAGAKPASPAAHTGHSRTDHERAAVDQTERNHTRQLAELDWLPRLLAAGPHPARLLRERELTAWLRDARPVTDVIAVPSPAPPAATFG